MPNMFLDVKHSVCLFVFFPLSYKAPAKGDGVDYVRTEDEVGENKIVFLY